MPSYLSGSSGGISGPSLGKPLFDNSVLTATLDGVTHWIKQSDLVSGVVPTKNVIYVATNGSDINLGTSTSKPKATISAALALATSGMTIIIFSGNYTEPNPLVVPVDVTIIGQDSRVTITPKYVTTDVFQLNSGSVVRGVTVINHRSPSFAFSIGPGANLRTPPIIRECSSISGPYLNDGTLFIPGVTVQRADTVPALLPILGTTGIITAKQIATDKTGGGISINGANIIADSLCRTVIVDQFVARNQGGMGVLVKNKATVMVSNSITEFCRDGFSTQDGGTLNLSACTVNYGLHGLTSTAFYPTQLAYERIVAVASHSSIQSINVISAGNGYYTSPIVDIQDPLTAGGTKATAIAIIKNGKVVNIIITSGGSGYTSIPAVTIAGNATATATLSGITKIQLDTPAITQHIITLNSGVANSKISMFYAYPASYGYTTFKDQSVIAEGSVDTSDFSGGWDAATGDPNLGARGPATILSDSEGVITQYYLYQTDHTGLGSITWSVTHLNAIPQSSIYFGIANANSVKDIALILSLRSATNAPVTGLLVQLDDSTDKYYITAADESSITIQPPIPAIAASRAVKFFRPSVLTAVGQTFNDVGSGTTMHALSTFAGTGAKTNEVLEAGYGKIYHTSLDTIGQYAIGDTVSVNQLTGELNVADLAISSSVIQVGTASATADTGMQYSFNADITSSVTSITFSSNGVFTSALVDLAGTVGSLNIHVGDSLNISGTSQPFMTNSWKIIAAVKTSSQLSLAISVVLPLGTYIETQLHVSLHSQGFFGYQRSTDSFTFIPSAIISQNTVSGEVGTINANLVSNLAILTGGSSNNMPIGAVTPAAGSFTTVAANSLTALVGFTITNKDTTILDSFSADTGDAVKYIIKIKDMVTKAVRSQETMLAHDLTNVYMTEYGIIDTGIPSLGNIIASMTSNVITMSYVPATTNTLIVKIFKVYI